MIRIAAIQLEAVLGDVAENLRRCRALAQEAAAAGAEWIVLPEFFTTGMAYVPSLAEAALPLRGAAYELLRELALRHRAVVGGSFICRGDDGANRNTWLLLDADGGLLGRHDKDLPTMWENCFYVGGSDDGVIEVGRHGVGVALCWELMRTQTVARMRGRVDLLLSGSAWWSIPRWPPIAVSGRMEAANARTAASVAPAMARALGVPVAHAAHCGSLRCPMPLVPGIEYAGHYEGGAGIVDGNGAVLAWRSAEQGPGIAVADVQPLRREPTLQPPHGFWVHRRGALPALAWNYQAAHGRRWYRKHAAGCPPETRSLAELAPDEDSIGGAQHAASGPAADRDPAR